jgi:hypothetical protein
LTVLTLTANFFRDGLDARPGLEPLDHRGQGAGGQPLGDPAPLG